MKQYLIGAGLWLMSIGGLVAQPAPTGLSLDKAIQLALQNNKSIKLADSRTEAAESRVQEVKDRNLPQRMRRLLFRAIALRVRLPMGRAATEKPCSAFRRGHSMPALGASR